jgi:hypothetical protein
MSEQLHPGKSPVKPPLDAWGQLCHWSLQRRRGGKAGVRPSTGVANELWLRIFFLASKCFTSSSIKLLEQPSRRKPLKTNSSHPNSLNNSGPATASGHHAQFFFLSQAVYFHGSWVSAAHPRAKMDKVKFIKTGAPHPDIWGRVMEKNPKCWVLWTERRKSTC